MKNEYIYERKGKKGLTLQVKIPEKKDGKRTFRTESFKVSDFPSKAAAYEFARMRREQMLVDIRNNVPGRNSPIVRDLYEKYWEMSPFTMSTRKQYKTAYNFAVKPLEHLPISEVSAADIQELLAKYADTHTEKMVGQVKTMWHNIFKTAQMLGMNIADKTLMLLPVKSRVVPVPKKHPEIISYNDFVEFTRSLLDRTGRKPKTERIDRDVWYMLWIMYYTGCRPAEVLALSREDINLETGFISITKSVGSSRTERRQILVPKSDTGNRSVPIVPQLRIVLEDLLAHSDTSPLLVDKDGLPYDIRDISDRVTVTRRMTGIQFNAYQLRHKFSDDLFAGSVSPVVVRDLMGHTSDSMSLRYAKATAEQMKQGINSREQDGNKMPS